MPIQSDVLARARAFVFDAYGTIFDVHSAVVRHSAAVGPEAARLSEIWRAKQLEYSWILSLCSRYEPFWSLTERALDYALSRCPTVDRSLRVQLLDSYRTLDAYLEAPTALLRLRQRSFRTGILSNGSTDMLASAVHSAGLREAFDEVLSVDAAQVFKTDPRTYALVTAAFGLSEEEVVFVSSNRWDVAGASAFGFQSVWVNRAGLPEEYDQLPPAAVIDDLASLL